MGCLCHNHCFPRICWKCAKWTGRNSLKSHKEASSGWFRGFSGCFQPLSGNLEGMLWVFSGSFSRSPLRVSPLDSFKFGGPDRHFSSSDVCRDVRPKTSSLACQSPIAIVHLPDSTTVNNISQFQCGMNAELKNLLMVLFAMGCLLGDVQDGIQPNKACGGNSPLENGSAY